MAPILTLVAVITLPAAAEFDFADSTVIPTAAGVADVILADLDGDGDLDIASLEGFSFPSGQAFISVLLNDGSGGFGAPVVIDLGNQVGLEFFVQDIEAGDIDGDGDVDLAFNGSIAPLTFLFNEGDGTFGNPQPTAITNDLGQLNGQLEIADLDGDGDADFVVAKPLRVVFQGPKGGLSAVDLPNGSAGDQLAVADLNGDGHPDITFGFRVMLNDGTGLFTEVGSIPTGGLRACALADLDGDMDSDVACARTFSQQLAIALNDGAGGFGRVTFTETVIFPARVDVGHFDGDGIPDLVMRSTQGTEIYPGLGGGSIGEAQSIATLVGNAQAVGDLDGDGLDDLVLGVATPMFDPADGAVDIRLNRTGLTTPGDIDGDGDVDTADLLTLLSAWGVCPPPPAGCPADLDGNGIVGTADLLTLLANFG